MRRCFLLCARLLAPDPELDDFIFRKSTPVGFNTVKRFFDDQPSDSVATYSWLKRLFWVLDLT